MIFKIKKMLVGQKNKYLYLYKLVTWDSGDVCT